MEKTKQLLSDWKFILIVLIASIIADVIGPITIPLWGAVKVTLMPLLYSMAIITVLYLWKGFSLVGPAQIPTGTLMLSISMIMLMSKLGASVGTSIQELIKQSVPLLMSNLADSMTFILALPVALLLGMKREAIGITFASSREAGLTVIESRYGNKEEFAGVVTTYIVGTVFGSIVVSLFTSIFVSSGLFSLDAIAMAAGIGSAAMSTAAMGVLIEQFPAVQDTVSAFVVASNLISSALAVYVGLFVNLPLTEWYYKLLYPILHKDGRRKAQAKRDGKVYNSETETYQSVVSDVDEITEKELVDVDDKVVVDAKGQKVKVAKDSSISKDEWGLWLVGLGITIVMGMVGNLIRFKVSPIESLPGLLLLAGAGLLGLIVTKKAPGNLPSLVYVSIIAALLTIPWNPMSTWTVPLINKIGLLALTSNILAYAGITIGRDWEKFKAIGWRGILVGIVVIFSAYFWGAVVAEFFIRIMP